MKKHHFSRIIGAFLALSLTISPSAWGLRPAQWEDKERLAGLEEKLQGGSPSPGFTRETIIPFLLERISPPLTRRGDPQAKKASLSEFAAAFSSAVRQIDPDYTYPHMVRSAEQVSGVIQELRVQGMNIPPVEEDMTRIGVSLHDVGKIITPGQILFKPGPLTDEEWKIMRRHPVDGARILEKVASFIQLDAEAQARLTAVSRIIHTHHEQLDGRGYPEGLQEGGILLGARIAAVLDASDAMANDRPYRSAMTPEATFAELKRVSGTQLDPLVVDAFIALQSRPSVGLEEEDFDPAEKVDTFAAELYRAFGHRHGFGQVVGLLFSSADAFNEKDNFFSGVNRLRKAKADFADIHERLKREGPPVLKRAATQRGWASWSRRFQELELGAIPKSWMRIDNSDPLSAIPAQWISTMEEINPRAEGTVYVVRQKPSIAKLGPFLRSRRREFEIYGFTVHEIPHLALKVGTHNTMGVGPTFHVDLYQRGEAVSLRKMIHNHDGSFALPSRGDYLVLEYCSREWPKLMRLQQDFVYGPRTGRLVEYGIGRRRPPGMSSQLRLLAWKKGEAAPRELWIPGTSGRTLYTLQAGIARERYLRNLFYRILRHRNVIRVEIDDADGRWARWDRGVTLTSVLTEGGFARTDPPLSGLEEIERTLVQMGRWRRGFEKDGMRYYPRFEREMQTWVRRPEFFQWVSDSSVDPVLRFFVLQALENIWTVSADRQEASLMEFVLEQRRGDIRFLMDPKGAEPRDQFSDVHLFMGAELSKAEWERLIRVKQIQWKIFEPYGVKPQVVERQAKGGYFSPTDLLIAVLALKKAGLTREKKLLELGSGLGHVLIAGAAVLEAEGIGYELDPALLRDCRIWLAELEKGGLIRPGQVQLRKRDFLKVRWPRADVIYHYPLVGSQKKPAERKQPTGLERRLISYGERNPAVRLVLYYLDETGEDSYLYFPTLYSRWKGEWLDELKAYLLAPRRPSKPLSAGLEESRPEERRDAFPESTRVSYRLIEDLKRWLAQHGRIEWEAGPRYGRVKADLVIDQSLEKVIRVRPVKEWASSFPELGWLQENQGGIHSEPGDFGQIVLEFYRLRNGRGLVLIEQIQPGWGYRRLKSKHRDPLDASRRKMLEKLIEWAESQDLLVFAVSPYMSLPFDYHTEFEESLSAYERRKNYQEPFDDPVLWKMEELILRYPLGNPFHYPEVPRRFYAYRGNLAIEQRALNKGQASGGLEERDSRGPVSPAGGEGPDVSRDPAWRRSHGWITLALQKHPGGPLKRMELAALAGVSRKALRRHNWRVLVAEDNARRAKLNPPLPALMIVTEDPRGAIQAALRAHPSGRLTVEKLATLAGVNRRTLYRHDYRALAVWENAHRAKLNPPLPAIKIQEHKEYKEPTEDPEAAIQAAFRAHPGGRLTVEELATLAGVSSTTLYRYDYRALVVKENARRVQLNPPLPIEINERRDWTQDWEEAIQAALRAHPGGRLIVEELATLADVSERTLSIYNYRILVAEENARRRAMQPPLPEIFLLEEREAVVKDSPVGADATLPAVPLEVAAHAHLLAVLQDNSKEAPHLIWRTVPTDLTQARDLLKDFVPQPSVRRIAVFDEELLSEQEAKSILPEDHPITFLIREMEGAKLVTPAVMEHLLKLQLAPDRIYLLELRRDELGQILLSVYA